MGHATCMCTTNACATSGMFLGTFANIAYVLFLKQVVKKIEASFIRFGLNSTGMKNIWLRWNRWTRITNHDLFFWMHIHRTFFRQISIMQLEISPQNCIVLSIEWWNFNWNGAFWPLWVSAFWHGISRLIQLSHHFNWNPLHINAL